MAQTNFDHYGELLISIIESSEDAIVSKDLSGIIRSWNKSAEMLFGYTPEEVIGAHVSILIPPDRLHEEDMIIKNIKEGKKISHYETIRRAKSGKLIDISLTVSPVKNKEGVIVGASKIARDITPQKLAAELQRKYVAQLEIINTVSKAIAGEIKEEKILQLVTDASTRITGASFGSFFYNKVDVKGESYTLFALSGAPREAFEKFGMPRNTAVFSKTFNGEGILRSDDITKDPRYGHNRPHKGMPEGHLQVVSYLAVPVVSLSNTVIGGLFFGHPEPGKFTEEHEGLVQTIASTAAISLDKARLYAEVQMLSTKKDEFIGFASHELKTPLTTIKGYLELANKIPAKSIELLPKIDKQVNRISAIIGDLLDMSKIQAGALTMHHEPVSLQSILRESIESVRPSWPLHEYDMEVPPQDILLHIDAQKIVQVVVNLLTNAAKYSEAGTLIEINSGQYGDAVRISVRDRGIGIAPDELSKVFNQFYRVTERAYRAEGLGLGLYISKEIVEAHHGKLWVESELGKGSVFTVELPVER